MRISDTFLAGMPSFQLTDLARMRIETISFFLLIFFASAWVIQKLWNSLRKDFSRLPELTYPRALSFSLVWAFLFVLILTMISGARELMTPGAWKKDEYTYRLNHPTAYDPRHSFSNLQDATRARFDQLYQALKAFALQHDNRFPTGSETSAIPIQLWQSPDPTHALFVYQPGLNLKGPVKPLVYEPAILGAHPLVLFTDGSIKSEQRTVIETQIGGNPP